MGLFSGKTHEFWAASIFELLEPGEADREARDYAIEQGGGELDAYIDIYLMGFRRNYRRTYSADFLKKYGFDTDESSIFLLDDEKLKSYVKSTIDPSATNIVYAYFGNPDMRDIAKYRIQQSYGLDTWNNRTESMIVETDGLWCDEWGDMIVSGNHDDPVQWCTYNVVYDEISTYTTFEGSDDYSPTGIVPERDENDPFKDILHCSLYGDRHSPVETQCHGWNYDDTCYERGGRVSISWTEPSDVLRSQQLVVAYETPSFPGNYVISLVPMSSRPDVFTEKSIELDVVVPMKVDGHSADSTRELRKVFKKLNINPDDLIDDLVKNHDVDNAYLARLVYPGGETQGELALLFETFKMFSTYRGNIEVRSDKLNMRWSFAASHSLKDGHQDFGHKQKYLVEKKRAKPVYDENGVAHERPYEDVLTIFKKISDDKYEEIVVTNYLCTYTISGKEFIGRLVYDDDSEGREHSRLFVPLEAINNLKWKEWVEAHERSIVVLAYSYEKVRTKWYQKGPWSMLIGIAISVASAGILAPEGMALAAASQAFMTAVAITAAINILTSIDPVLGAIAGVVLSVAVMTNFSFDFSSLNFGENYMKTISQLTDIVNKVNDLQFMNKVKSATEDIENQQEAYDELLSFSKEISGRDYVVFIDDYTTSNPDTSYGITPDQFYYLTSGEPLYDYDIQFDFDSAYEQRKNV
jgi:hypothetical protein